MLDNIFKHLWKGGIKVFKKRYLFCKIKHFSLPLKYVINVCTINMFRYTFVQKSNVFNKVFFPILLLNILNYITHKPLPFKCEKHGAVICKSVLWSYESKCDIRVGNHKRHVLRAKEEGDLPACYQR